MLRDGDVLKYGTMIGGTPAFEQYMRDNPQPIQGSTGAGRAALTGQVAHFHDVMADPSYRFNEGQRILGHRSLLSIPLLREQELVGTFSLARTVVEPFTPRQIELVRTFADQASIAIENTRLFNETKEALERQTATAEVLQVISSSVSDAVPVFEKILDSCQKLIECTDVSVLTVEQDSLVHLGSVRGLYGLNAARNYKPTPIRETIIARALEEGRTIHVPKATCPA